MANTKISALPTFTGDATGVYVVIDNSGLTQTYKITKEELIGQSGTSGTSGTSGSSGTSGTSGSSGTSGTSGSSGTSGTSGTGFDTISTPGTNRMLIASGNSTNQAIAVSGVTYDGSTMNIVGDISANNIGTVSSLNLNSSSSEVLFGDGTFKNVKVVGTTNLILNNVQGPSSNWSGTYNSGGGKLLVTAYASAFVSSTNVYNWTLKKNGTTVNTGSMYWNAVSSHMPLNPISYIDTSGDVGSATWSIVLGAGMNTDVADYATITVVETTGFTSSEFSAYNSVAVGLTNAATKVTYTTEEFDTNNNYDTSTSTFTPTIAGYYQVTVATMIPNTSIMVSSMIYKNGSKVADGPGGTGGGFFYGQSIASKLVYMNGTTDYLEGYAITSSGVNTYNNTVGTYFQAYMVNRV